MTTLFEEAWPGANGSAWDDSRWQNFGQDASSIRDVENGKGRLLPQGGDFARVKAQAIMTPVADFEFTGSWQMTTVGQQFHAINFRGGTAWSTSFGHELANCYRLSLSDGAWGLSKIINSVRTTLDGENQTWGVGVWNFRLRCEGQNIRARWWNGATEPTQWIINLQDATFGSGIIALGAVNGAASTGRPLLFGSLLVQTPLPLLLNTANLQDSANNAPPQLLDDLESAANGLDWTPVDSTQAIVAHVSFPPPYLVLPGNPQHFSADLYCTAGSPTTPAKGKLTLYEAGDPVAPEVSIEVDVTETGGQVVILPWSGSAVALPGGVELRIDGTPGATGGSPVNTVGIKSVEWRVNE